MLATVALSAAAVVVVGLLVWAFIRHDHADETERFHRAREITTSWAAPGPRFNDTVHLDEAAERAAQPAGPAVRTAAPPVPAETAVAADETATRATVTDDAAADAAPPDAASTDAKVVRVRRGGAARGAARDAVAGDDTDRG